MKQMDIFEEKGESFDYMDFFSKQLIAPHGKMKLARVWRAFEKQAEFDKKTEFIRQCYANRRDFRIVEIQPIAQLGYLVTCEAIKDRTLWYTHAANNRVSIMYFESVADAVLGLLCKVHGIAEETATILGRMFVEPN